MLNTNSGCETTYLTMILIIKNISIDTGKNMSKY